jgi:microcystin degradation protein MlrC
MRVGIIALQHESNTFIRGRTTLDDFRLKALLTGDDVRRRFERGHHEISGFIDGIAEAGMSIVPIFAASATPGGPVSADTYHQLLGMMLQQLAQAGPIDGLLVAPHGAGVCEAHADMDGHWLTKLRDHVGSRIPIISTLDPHANVSNAMVAACDAMIAYRSNPHLDQRLRGLEAASLMARTLRGEIRPVVAAALPPISINIERQLTRQPPCSDLYALADSMLHRPGVLSNSVLLGFPYADVAEMGSGFLVVTNDDRAAAQACADQLASYLILHRSEFLGKLIDPEEAIDTAAGMPGPVCLLDMGDNIGGGSPGDGTVLAHALHTGRVGRAFVALFDPDAVQQAAAVGHGASLELEVGGKTGPRHGAPLRIRGTLQSIHDGRFTESQARHGGASAYEMGTTVIIQTERGMTIQLTSRRTPPFSLSQLLSCGIQPQSFQFIVAKGVHAPVAAYETVCRNFIRVNTPGVTTADMTSLNFVNRRKPLFPFENEGLDR